MDKIKVLAIVGPTASGKSRLAIELAKIFGGEIICADSMQIYKEMTIGTAKIEKEKMQGIKHYLTDFLDLNENFSVAQYVKLARTCIFEINNKNKLPIICGGTGLYIENLLVDNLFLENSSDIKIKEKLNLELKKDGIEKLLLKLKKIDKKSYEKLNINDKKRILRALEFYYLTGKTLSEQSENSNKKSIYNEIIIGLNYKNREILYEKINKRVDLMIESGLVQEAEKILSKNPSLTAKMAIGYKELVPFFKKENSIKECVENIKKETRRYAKRQLTWFRRNKKILWIYLDEYKNFNSAVKICEEYIKKEENFFEDLQ